MTTKVNVLKSTVTLTALQHALISTILQQVHDCMEWDPEAECFTDGGNFILSLPQSAMPALKDLNIIFS